MDKVSEGSRHSPTWKRGPINVVRSECQLWCQSKRVTGPIVMLHVPTVPFILSYLVNCLQCPLILLAQQIGKHRQSQRECRNFEPKAKPKHFVP